MKMQLVFIILSIFSLEYCNAQNRTSNDIYNHLDTISLFYPTPTFDTANDGLNRYYLNDKRVDKKTSDIEQANGLLIDKCRPCVIKIYDSVGLIMSGVQSGDGRTGFWFEYYPKTGKIKVKGQYKKTATGNCTTSECSTPVGEWLFYNSKGILTKKEVYSNGKLIKKKKYINTLALANDPHSA
jgi:antitoxin component YwqK of YwqJK toxin-antitoxin module